MESIFSNEYANNYTIEDIEGIFDKEIFRITFTEDDMVLMEKAFNNSQNYTFNCQKDYEKFTRGEKLIRYNKTKMIEGYRRLIVLNKIKRNMNLEKFMRLKVARGNSGVVVITTFMSGTQFGDSKNIKRGGCPENCNYCPFEKDENGIPTQPRSYLSTEPGNKRATQNKHHPIGQTFDRADQLEKMGHISPFPDVSSKVEIIISGGTFNFFPHDYVEWYVTCTYYALNVYYEYKTSGQLRDMMTLDEEQKINETASLRMIGLTIETRPDRLTEKENPFEIVRFFRRLGVTRVQIGVQHTDDSILKYVNRNCTNAQNKKGISILKQNGFKTDIHLMLDLPMPYVETVNCRPEHIEVINRVEQNIEDEIPHTFKINALRDMMMIYEVITDPDYQADQWKVYPTETTPFTKILEWYESGKYTPYAEFANGKLLEAVIVYLKTLVHDYIRINRVVRDIPTESIYGGISCPEMRNNILSEMKKLGKVCNCIRCREVKADTFDSSDPPVLHIHQYESSGGTEYFISYENSAKTILYGMVRLRLNNLIDYVMDELYDCALIRELHVYGIHSGIGDSSAEKTQHKGLGRKLLNKAEEIAYNNGYEKIVVISGVGVKEYYRKNGYEDYHTYMIKQLQPPLSHLIIQFVFFLIFICFIVSLV